MTQHYEYAITFKGGKPGPQAALYPTWEAAQDALWNVQQTAPRHYVDPNTGDVVNEIPEFDIHARLVQDGWKVVTGEQTAVEDSADPTA